MKVILAIASLVVLGLPLTAAAQSSGGYNTNQSGGAYYSRLSYSYAELRLVSADYDGGGTADGLSVGGSLLFQPQLFALGSYTTIGDNGVDIDTLDLGLGYRYPLQANTDLLATVGVLWVDVDTPGGGGGDDSGIALSGGIRSEVAPQVELDGFVGYAEVGGDGDITLTGQGLLHVTQQLSLLASLGLSDDVNTLTIGGRWNFTPVR